jgi:hypothetical protein
MSAAGATLLPPVARRWPWPPLTDGWRHLLQTFCDVLPGHDTAGWELACRLGPEGLHTGRLLLALQPVGDTGRLASLPARLGLPAAAAQAFADGLASCHQVFLAAEQGPAGLLAKLYLEWPVPLAVVRPAPGARPAPSLQMRGWKWAVDAQTGGAAPTPAPQHWRCTDYLRWPLASPAAALDLLRAGHGAADEARPALALAADALAHALTRALARDTVGFDPALLLVHEPGSPRASCAVRLVDSGLRVAAVAADVIHLAALWRLDASAVAACMAAIAERELTWLAAGTDHRGRGFLTVYAAGSLPDLQHAMQRQPASAVAPASVSASLLDCAP